MSRGKADFETHVESWKESGPACQSNVSTVDAADTTAMPEEGDKQYKHCSTSLTERLHLHMHVWSMYGSYCSSTTLYL